MIYGLWEGWFNNLNEIRRLCEKYSKVKVIYDVGIRSAACNKIVSILSATFFVLILL